MSAGPTGGWPAFDRLLGALGFVPSRTGSVITTVYGDAILPRGGSLALADLLVLMRRLGASDGVVRTAVSRLARDGVLAGRRTGRTSAYALTERSRVAFAAAVPVIYGSPDRDWDGVLHLLFPEDPAERAALERPGVAVLAPGVLVSLDPVDGAAALRATGGVAEQRRLAARAWPADGLAAEFAGFMGDFAVLEEEQAPSPLDAMAARITVVHAYRRLALRTPRLPAVLRPEGWPGDAAFQRFRGVYRGLLPLSEGWLDQVGSGSGPLPPRAA